MAAPLPVHLRTVSDQLQESMQALASLGALDTPPPNAGGGSPEAETDVLIERIRELESQAQSMREGQRELLSWRGPAPAPERRTPRRRPKAPEETPEEAATRPAWGSPLGTPGRPRSRGRASPHRPAARSPGPSRRSGRARTPTGQPPANPEERELTATKKAFAAEKRQMLKENRRLRAKIDALSAASAEAVRPAPPSRAEADGASEPLSGWADDPASRAELRCAELEAQCAGLQRRVAEAEAAALAAQTPAEPARQRRRRSMSRSPARSKSPGGSSASGEKASGGIILSRGSRAEKEQMLAELALLRQRVEEADGRTVAEAQARLAVEGKLSEAEGLASELARALSVMTAHCEELERQHEAQAAQAAMVEKATAARAAEVQATHEAEVRSVGQTERAEREAAESSLSEVVEGVVAAQEERVGGELGDLSTTLAASVDEMQAQLADARTQIESEYTERLDALGAELARERGERYAKPTSLLHMWGHLCGDLLCRLYARRLG